MYYKGKSRGKIRLNINLTSHSFNNEIKLLTYNPYMFLCLIYILIKMKSNVHVDLYQ